MAIEKTQFLSKLSLDELRAVHQKWPNPLTVLAFFLGLVLLLGFLALVEGPELAAHPERMAGFVGKVAGLLVLFFGLQIWVFVRLAKAKKVLDGSAANHQLPAKDLRKEFTRNYSSVSKALKRA
jgi:hypothetical protein